MSNLPEPIRPASPQAVDFEQISRIVSSQFQVEEAKLVEGIPTFCLRYPQETKQAFLRLLNDLDKLNLIAILRRISGRITLRIVSKPPRKPSNILINWLLFFATIGTTFATGYILSEEMIDPLLGGITFTIAIMTVLGMHEMGHKLTANKRGIDATSPYFIPGPPPIGGLLGIGTFGALIMQKSLPNNRDSLFDVGASGPIVGFILALIPTVIGLWLSPIFPITHEMSFLPSPFIFSILLRYFVILPPDYYIRLHPVAFAGWVGILVTMLNLLPAAMLDGGHVARSSVGEKLGLVLTGLSILFLIVTGFLPMAIFVLFMAMYKHPGPLDDVSGLSAGRKLVAVILVAIFLLCAPLPFLL